MSRQAACGGSVAATGSKKASSGAISHPLSVLGVKQSKAPDPRDHVGRALSRPAGHGPGYLSVRRDLSGRHGVRRPSRKPIFEGPIPHVTTCPLIPNSSMLVTERTVGMGSGREREFTHSVRTHLDRQLADPARLVSVRAWLRYEWPGQHDGVGVNFRSNPLPEQRRKEGYVP